MTTRQFSGAVNHNKGSPVECEERGIQSGRRKGRKEERTGRGMERGTAGRLEEIKGETMEGGEEG